MRDGWICLHRQMMESEIWGASHNVLRTWLWCLFRANHEPTKVFGKLLDRGSFVTSTIRGAEELEIPRSTFLDALKWLEARGMISRQSDTQRTTISVCNYGTYQDRNGEVRHQPDINPTSTRHQPDTNPTQRTIKQQEQLNNETKKPRRRFSDEDMELARWMYSKVVEVAPKAKEPRFESWANEIRLMCKEYKIDHAEARRVFAWANENAFWCTNILSPAKLRKQYPILESKMKERRNGQSARKAGAGVNYEPDNDEFGRGM